MYYGTEGYNAADIDDLRQPRPRGRPPRDRRAGRDAGVRQPAHAVPRSSPSSATSATRSPAPTRRSDEFADEYEAWCSPESPIFDALESGDLDLTTDEMSRGARRRGRPDRRRRRRSGPAPALRWRPNPRRPDRAGQPLVTARDRAVNSVDTDVLVVGGGPAGSAAALRLAALGHRVTLVEKRPRRGTRRAATS